MLTIIKTLEFKMCLATSIVVGCTYLNMNKWKTTKYHIETVGKKCGAFKIRSVVQ